MPRNSAAGQPRLWVDRNPDPGAEPGPELLRGVGGRAREPPRRGAPWRLRLVGTLNHACLEGRRMI